MALPKMLRIDRNVIENRASPLDDASSAEEEPRLIGAATTGSLEQRHESIAFKVDWRAMLNQQCDHGRPVEL